LYTTIFGEILEGIYRGIARGGFKGFLGYENGYHFKRKKESEPPFRNSTRQHFHFLRGTKRKQFKKASHAISEVTIL